MPGIYWHFVDIMWIVVYFTVYIVYHAPCRLARRIRCRSEGEMLRLQLYVIVVFAVLIAAILIVRAVSLIPHHLERVGTCGDRSRETLAFGSDRLRPSRRAHVRAGPAAHARWLLLDSEGAVHPRRAVAGAWQK